MDTVKTGRFISELRKEKNMTQQQMAEKLFVSDKAVSRWETGRGFPEIGILENIADLLDVSVSEIIRGERIADVVSSKELTSITEESIRLSKEYIERKKIGHFFTGFLCAMILLITAVAHLNSPIYFDDPGQVLEIRADDGAMVTAVLDENVAGYEIETVKDEAGNVCRFVSCYKTKWHELFGRKEKKIALLDDDGEADLIYYYPTQEGDVLLYGKDKIPSGGVITLPRLIYNYWTVLGIAFSVIGIVIYFLFRNRYFAETIRKIILLPISFTISLFLILTGHFTEVYNASYYFSKILLLAAVIYLLLLNVLRRKKESVRSAEDHKGSNGC